ncbi:AI-2E family transporter [uncultured Helicobacter sp.]|uniref:AI-2E family transporter n=1 Tax=uncultured Helicobacter sp. TaxID=175537 RepID=UPI002623C9F8|nr:AI-2E family transporter [uncultured Helicobacter sp.]
MQRAGVYFFLVIFTLTLFALFKLYSPFLMNLLIAFLLFIATQNIYYAILRQIKSRWISTFLVTFLLVILCFLPIFYILLNLVTLATNLELGNFHNFLLDLQMQLGEYAREFFAYLPDLLQKEVNNWLAQFSAINWAEVAKKGLGIIAKVSQNSLYFLSDTFFILVFLFFFYYYGSALGQYFLALIPIKPLYIQSLYDEVSAVISVVFYSSIFSMLLQGALFGILMAFLGYNALLLGVFYGFASLVPIVGGSLVWLPIAGYELYLGNYGYAIMIALYSIIVIATLADNGVKPLIISFINRVFIKTPLKINEMLIFFAILAGLTSFGFWGIVFGPAITALFIALLRVYKNLIKDNSSL